jgi:hypothetical protein
LDFVEVARKWAVEQHKVLGFCSKALFCASLLSQFVHNHISNMRSYSVLAVAAGIGSAIAQRPADMSICDYYTTALLKTNNGTTQKALVSLVVNTAVIGNYTMPNVGIAVPGILANGTFNGTEVHLLKYFDGSLASSNRGGMSGVSVNFLDDGGAAPLMMGMPANGTSSNQ